MSALHEVALPFNRLNVPSSPTRLHTPRVEGTETQKVGTELDPGYDGWVPLPRRSHVPIRATLTVLMVGVVVLEGILAKFGMAAPTELLLALIPLVGGAVYGDTIRPSGMAPAAKAKPLAD